MFDRAVCRPMQIARDPRVGLAALSALRALLVEVAGSSGQLLSSNTPVSGPARGPGDQNPGDAHATPKSLSCIRSQASPAARSVRSSRSGELHSAGPGVASAARRDPSDRDRLDGAAAARTRPRRSPSDREGVAATVQHAAPGPLLRNGGWRRNLALGRGVSEGPLATEAVWKHPRWQSLPGDPGGFGMAGFSRGRTGGNGCCFRIAGMTMSPRRTGFGSRMCLSTNWICRHLASPGLPRPGA
jgi:hypothetical protein